MDFESQFGATMTQTVVLREPTGRDTYGAPTYAGATPVTVHAWVSKKPREVRTLTGDERVSAAEIHLGHPSGGGAVPIPSPECEITLPDGSKPAILAVASIVDPQGDLHCKVFV